MSLSGLPPSSATSPAATPTASATATPKRRIRAPPPKNCPCEWCGATFTKSGLGRHYDQWVYAASPARADEKHTESAICRMRELRSDVRRLREMRHMDPKEKKSLQNRRNYERHQEQQVEKKRVKRIADMARSMVLKELAKEVEEIQAAPSTAPAQSTLTPTSAASSLNFATLAYHFLPPPTATAATPPPQPPYPGTWSTAHPDIHEYTALYSLFRHPTTLSGYPSSDWLPRLNEEWTRWQALSDTDKARLAIQEACRELARRSGECEGLRPYKELWGAGRSLAERAAKWEGRAAQLREVHGRAEEVALTGELDRMWSERGEGAQGGDADAGFAAEMADGGDGDISFG